MKHGFLFMVFWAVGLVSVAQVQIAVQTGNSSSFYFSFLEAVQAAPDGAIVYLPAGTFETENVVITKPLTIIGIGHNPAGNPNNEVTKLLGDLKLRVGADGSVLKGFVLSGSLHLGDENDNVSLENITLSRVNVEGYSTYLSDGSVLWPTRNVLLHECIFDSFNGGYAVGVLALKNVFTSAVVNLKEQATFRNNLFLYNGPTDAFLEITNATFENNIFVCGIKGISVSQMLNNLFMAGTDVSFEVYHNTASGNLTGETLETTFVDVPRKEFSYSYNYQLRGTSPGVSAGTDGTHVGLFGTTQPFKVAGTPDVPHIESYSINSATDSQGRLFINIKVSAQSN